MTSEAMTPAKIPSDEKRRQPRQPVEARIAHAEAADNLGSVGGGKLLVQGHVGHERGANVLAGNGQRAEMRNVLPRNSSNSAPAAVRFPIAS